LATTSGGRDVEQHGLIQSLASNVWRRSLLARSHQARP
jgi:hypothetical protein